MTNGINPNESECPRCFGTNIIEVHGHYQCSCGFYVYECCQGEIEQIIAYKPDPIEDMIDICESLISSFDNRNENSNI